MTEMGVGHVSDVRLHGCPSGDGRHNFTYEDLKAAAGENGKSVAETFEVVTRTTAKDKEDHPQEYAPGLLNHASERGYRFKMISCSTPWTSG
jgi:hypothetical protein